MREDLSFTGSQLLQCAVNSSFVSDVTAAIHTSLAFIHWWWRPWWRWWPRPSRRLNLAISTEPSSLPQQLPLRPLHPVTYPASQPWAGPLFHVHSPFVIFCPLFGYTAFTFLSFHLSCLPPSSSARFTYAFDIQTWCPALTYLFSLYFPLFTDALLQVGSN